MPYHDWNDDTFDWKSLDDAGNYLTDNCRRYARLGLWTKEKYGTLRVSTTCAFFTEYDFIHHIFYPGYARYTFPRWFRTYIDWPVGRVLGKLGVISLIQRYQLAVLRRFWQKAAERWPHIAEEILDEYRWL